MAQRRISTAEKRRPARVGFITIGQSPRDDIVPEMLVWVGMPIEVAEFGALDALSPDQIEALAPSGDEPRLVSRLRDGSEVVASRAHMHEQVRALLEDADRQDLDAIVLLCTGQFPPVQLRTPFVSAQAAVDLGGLALARDVRTVGLLVPNETQARAIEAAGWNGLPAKAAHSTPYGDSRFEEAARDLADTDLIVMHCMGYGEAMLEQVRAASDVRPS